MIHSCLQVAATAARVLSSIQANDVTPAQFDIVADILARAASQLPAGNSSTPSGLSRTYGAVSDLQQFLLDRLVRTGFTCMLGKNGGALCHCPGTCS